jgi:hypothetical protein
MLLMVATKKRLDRDLIEHARDQLDKIARRHVKAGKGPETAARLAIRETQLLFPHGWRLAVQGDDGDDHVEVWEVEHKFPSPIASIEAPRGRSHATKRWSHKDIAKRYRVDEDIVRRIYAAIQEAKKQGLYGGHTVDLIERRIGRRPMGGEYTVSTLAHEHLGHKPPSGYGGPKPRGSAVPPPRAEYNDPKIENAGRMAASAERVITDVQRRKDPWADWSARDRQLLREAADDLDVAADLYEKAGANIRAGTLHERARHARNGDASKLAAYVPV